MKKGKPIIRTWTYPIASLNNVIFTCSAVERLETNNFSHGTGYKAGISSKWCVNLSFRLTLNSFLALLPSLTLKKTADKLCHSWTLRTNCAILERCGQIVPFLKVADKLCHSWTLRTNCAILERRGQIVPFLNVAGKLCHSWTLRTNCAILERCGQIVPFLNVADKLCHSWTLNPMVRKVNAWR